ncbi:hypothetical protein EDC94DRAFT_648416 [Helicostylum pulchrum]|nr:hypothetical protein EDC94DRAFT_648416 [Helicostylum pulchrum]
MGPFALTSSFTPKISEELECSASKWSGETTLNHLKLFDSGHVPINNLLQTNIMLRRLLRRLVQVDHRIRHMLYSLYKSTLCVLREIISCWFHFVRTLKTKSLQLPEEKDDMSSMLLPILKAANQGRLITEHTNVLVRRAPKETEINLNRASDLILPCYNVLSGKKRRDSEA